MKTLLISKSRLSQDTMNKIISIVSVSNETDFAFDATGTKEQLSNMYSVIDPIQSRNPFIKQL